MMKRNPLVPFALIAVIGIVIMISVGMWGGNIAHDRAAKENGSAGQEQQANNANAKPEDIYAQNCASCHGKNLEGKVGPALKNIGSKLSEKDILNQIKNGGGGMPPGVVKGEAAQKVAKWLAKKK